MPARTDRRPAIVAVAFAAVLSAAASAAHAQSGPSISDAEFWRLMTEISEAGGVFQPQLMSNEDSAQFVLPELERTVAPGGVYIGVGSEQNFTYLATLRPRLAFVVDIRRDNLLQLLMYKALFEIAGTRAEFVSRLFSRPRPDAAPSGASVRDLFGSFEPLAADAALFDETSTLILERLTHVHGWPLSDEDRAAMIRMLDAFRTAGPSGLRGYGDRNPSYAELMAMADLDGRQQSYLASDDRFEAVRTLQLENRIVPIVGDFGGERALDGIARELDARGERVGVFYVSNVERYLWERGGHEQFYDNVAALPRLASSVFIRSLTTDISQRQNIPIPAGPARWRTLLFSIDECLRRVAGGRIQAYRDLFVPTAP
jgi:hypothetical protein